MKIIYTLIKLIILALFLILALLNTKPVPFAYLPGQEVQWPLIFILFITFLIGTIFGLFSLLGRLLRLRNENARLKKEVQKLSKKMIENSTTSTPKESTVQPETENNA